MGAGLVALIRRALVAVLTGMAVAAAIRLRVRLRVRRRAVPPQTGGWRELGDDELAGGDRAGRELGDDELAEDETFAEQG